MAENIFKCPINFSSTHVRICVKDHVPFLYLHEGNNLFLLNLFVRYLFV